MLYCFKQRRTSIVSCCHFVCEKSGQSTVEAAYIIPVIFLLLLLLIQPGILIYNLTVMEAAASEGCRILATKPVQSDQSSQLYHDYVMRRLGSMPPQEIFHVHEGGCTWNVSLNGDETTETVDVEISHKVKLLPLLDVGASVFGISNSSGQIEQKVSRSMPTQPQWVAENSLGLNPSEWVEQWA